MGTSRSKHMPQALKDIDEFDQKTAAEYEEAFKSGGMSQLNKKIDADIDKWRNIPVNIAVTGNSGVGKSSFINSFRGLKAMSKDAAAVGVNETTLEPTKYMHPNNNNIALWDLPGIGTEKFPKETYLEKVDFEKYDCFLIITANRFTENDIWLAKEVQNLKKKFFFIRTKMNTEVENNQNDYGKSKSETVKEIQEDMTQQVTEKRFENVKVYLIDNRSDQDYDFPKLIEDMIKEAPKWKQEAMALTMTTLTEDLINRKRRALRKRILIVALGSAAGGTVPMPGASLAVDTAIIMKEVDIYKQQFGINDESLKKTASSLKQAFDNVKGGLRTGGATVAMISHFATTLAASECAEKVTAFVLPVLGSIIAAGISYGSTVSILRSLLDECVSDARDINKQLKIKMSESNPS
ncbi:T-cell-specific guanine nucleotide triphosphate-binding protein 2-like [Ruditapes philippinarum]|uniref:T-cell-specific guanine nucleotide triphosphate-binding protein 2-like n=1 Tax=Ruditapes philippinarum TaxID=129788 RepID=UPI00295ADD98|nr:T-cell-specific guanine nucleotide triphosphate-binding protein 2-like [Ruditapes philippinarum]XP_060578228.1 T-cell-specific guanine nucleotide triphosphate-binding protein 2-like [Ruditapes philippinarum]